MCDKREVLIGLAQQLSVSLTVIFRNRLGDACDDGVEKNLKFAEGQLRTSVSGRRHDRLAEDAVLRTTESRLKPSRSRCAPCPAAVVLSSGDGPNEEAGVRP